MGLFRPDPRLPAYAMTTYRIVSPRDQSIIAACQAVGCAHWRDGWDNILDLAVPAHAKVAEFFRSGKAERTYREIPGGGTIVVFRFDAHQRCFQEHRTRPQVFIKRGGDWRGNPRQEFVRHRTAADWQEDFAEHQDELATAVGRG